MIQKTYVHVIKGILSLGIFVCIYIHAEDALTQAIKEAQPVEVMNLLENPFIKNTLNSEDKKWYIKLAHKVAQDKSVQCAHSGLDKYDLACIALGIAATGVGAGVLYGANRESMLENPYIENSLYDRIFLSSLGALVGSWGIQRLLKAFGKDHRYQKYIKSLAVLKLLEQK